MPSPFRLPARRDLIAEDATDTGQKPAVQEEHEWVDQMVEKKRVDIKLKSVCFPPRGCRFPLLCMVSSSVL
jgi:hypothetical protein